MGTPQEPRSGDVPTGEPDPARQSPSVTRPGEQASAESESAPRVTADVGAGADSPMVGAQELRAALRQLAQTQGGLVAQLHQVQGQMERLAAQLDPSIASEVVGPPPVPVGPPVQGFPIWPAPGAPAAHDLPSDHRGRGFVPPAPVPGSAHPAGVGARPPMAPAAMWSGAQPMPIPVPPNFPPPNVPRPAPHVAPAGAPSGAGLPRPAWNESGPPKSEPWFRRSEALSVVLAVGGAVVVLVGVTFLLLLAPQQGLFGPVPRTVVAAVLAVGLGAAAYRIRRQRNSDVGAVALAAAAMTTALLDVLAITTRYAWIPTWLGLLLAGLITVAGMLVAQRWASQLMGSLALATGIVLAVPIGSRHPAELMAFLIAVNLAALVVERGRHWPATLLARSVPTVLITWVVVLNVPIAGSQVVPSDVTLTWFSGAALTAIGLIAAVLPSLEEQRLLRSVTPSPDRGPGGVQPSPVAPGPSPVPAGLRVQSVASALLVPAMSWPVIDFALRQGAVPTMITSGVVAAVMFPLQWIRAFAIPLRATAGAWSAVVVVIFAQAAWGQPRIVTTVLAIAAGQLIASLVWSSRISWWLGMAAMGLGTFVLLPDLFAQLIPRTAARELDVWTVVDAALLCAALVAAYLRVRRDHILTPWASAAAFAVTGMLAGNLAFVAGGVSLFRATHWAEGALSGFRVGHAIATVVWISLALYLVRRGLTKSSDVARRTGLLIALLAVVKLFVVDLLAVSGVARVLAFIVVGVALIVLGTWYARVYEATRRDSGPAGPDQPGDPATQQPWTPPGGM